MSEFCIIAFDRIGVGLAFRNRIATPVVPQRGIHIEGITIILVGFIEKSFKHRTNDGVAILLQERGFEGSQVQVVQEAFS